MTHDELLAKIDESIKGAEFEERWMWTTNAKALRAVVELHKSYNWNGELVCEHCSNLRDYSFAVVTYPCDTIEAIEKELG